jgi:hypothetical protein
VTRWLSILLAVVLGGLSPSNAHALTRASRTTYDAGASLGKVVFVAGITMDTYQGQQRRPLSLHKYLYCQANPVNMTDPSGYDGDLATLEVVSTEEVEMEGSANLITSIAFQEAERSIVYKIGAYTIVGALVTANVVAPAAFVASEINVSLQRTKLKTKIQNEEEQTGGNILFHYTDAISGSQIASYQRILASPPYTVGNFTFPQGAYATDIPPWSTEYTQGELSGLFYGGVQHHDVSAFVAIKQNDFFPVQSSAFPHQWCRPAAADSMVPVSVVAYGPNLMDR